MTRFTAHVHKDCNGKEWYGVYDTKLSRKVMMSCEDETQARIVADVMNEKIDKEIWILMVIDRSKENPQWKEVFWGATEAEAMSYYYKHESVSWANHKKHLYREYNVRNVGE